MIIKFMTCKSHSHNFLYLNLNLSFHLSISPSLPSFYPLSICCSDHLELSSICLLYWPSKTVCILLALSISLTIWNPPLSVSRFRSQFMNLCRPPNSATSGVPNRGISVCVFMHVCMYVCMCVCVHVCMYVCEEWWEVKIEVNQKSRIMKQMNTGRIE